jgi:hypothetical protein
LRLYHSQKLTVVVNPIVERYVGSVLLVQSSDIVTIPRGVEDLVRDVIERELVQP